MRHDVTGVPAAAVVEVEGVDAQRHLGVALVDEALALGAQGLQILRGQDVLQHAHLLVGQSPDHEVWWPVFRPELVARHVTAPHPLLEDDPPGTFSRRVTASGPHALFGELHENRINAGLGYLLMLAWHPFRGSDDVVGGTDVHPAVRAVAHILRTDPDAGDLSSIARRAEVSPTYLSRLFKAQTGISLSRYRNQQRLQRFLLAYGDGEHTTALAAALEAGFGSYAQFYRVYRQEVTDGRGPRRGRG